MGPAKTYRADPRRIIVTFRNAANRYTDSGRPEGQRRAGGVVEFRLGVWRAFGARARVAVPGTGTFLSEK
jgi:hypothetical protein